MMRRLIWPLVAALKASIAFGASPPAQYTVTAVHDGDTVFLRNSSTPEPVKSRLRSIDAPELAQPWGLQSTAALAAMIGGKTVTVIAHGHDKYGRLLVDIAIGSQDINLEMVATGNAWAVSAARKKYRVAQSAAQGSALGLFGQPNPIPPWIYRKTHP